MGRLDILRMSSFRISTKKRVIEPGRHKNLGSLPQSRSQYNRHQYRRKEEFRRKEELSLYHRSIKYQAKTAARDLLYAGL